MTDVWTWEEMARAFTALGGAVDNVRHGQGAHGHGLFAIDPQRPVRVHVPPNVLLAARHAVFDGDTLRARPNAPIGASERDFFARYHDAFGWGGGGRAGCIAIVEALDALPAAIRDRLVHDFQLGPLFEGPVETRARIRFVTARAISLNGARTLMPVMELVNHSPDAGNYGKQGSIEIGGVFVDEILVRYKHTDAFGIFSGWGFVSREPLAFSLPVLLARDGWTIAVMRQTSRRPPILAVRGKMVTLSHLVLANTQAPASPRETFVQLMADTGLPNTGGIFDDIHAINRQKFETLRTVLDAHDGPTVAQLRDMCGYQLDALSAVLP